ncbi:hypothetical protein A3860_36160 [Niastella vici]|uniref:AB hydrolase-1 domain-containing protein n=1 Tax=Niastella vici TaxID=1703345 RepID=A0A1V9FMZ0_9BACT|nr:alpha/beta hydrolase [Niastella vici]OQP59719.1 hypothetical protein A3860_36160 [Niastella vici]
MPILFHALGCSGFKLYIYGMKMTGCLLLFFCFFHTCYAAIDPIEGSVKAGGFSIKYSEAGSGESLIFVHAGMLDRHMWDNQLAFFSRRYRVITFDLPAHGETMGTDTTILVSEVINILMDSLKIQHASFVGLSLGSVCVSEFVLSHPERVKEIVLVSPGFIGSTKQLTVDSLSKQLYAKTDAALMAHDNTKYARLFTSIWCVGPFRDSSQVPATLRQYIYQTVLANCKNHSQNDWRPFGKIPTARALGNIKSKTLLINGGKDVPFNLTMANYLLAVIRSTGYVIRNAAHMVNLDYADLFNKKVLDFLLLY